MAHIADQSLLRLNNQKAIIEELLKGEPKSRAMLSKSLNMSKPAITDNVEILLAKGILYEVGEGASDKKGGRKPILLDINKTYKYIMAIDFNSKKPYFALSNLRGEILKDYRLKLPLKAETHIQFELIKDTIFRLLKECQVSQLDAVQIVLSLPGVVRNEQDIILVNPQFEILTQSDLIGYLNKNLEMPIVSKNDVNTAVLGEVHYGRGIGKDSVIYLSCGMGIGAGIYLDGKLYEGKRFSAGEICYFLDRRRLQLGQTLEEELSMSALINRVQKYYANNQREVILEFEDIIEAYYQGDAFVLSCIEEIGEELGILVSNMACILDIDLIILGGEYLIFEEYLIPAMKRVISKLGKFELEIVASELREKVGIYGSFVIGLDAILKDFNIEKL